MPINPKDLSKESLEINSNLKLFQIYKNLKRESLKCDTYFQVYEEMFNKYVGKKITFVEVGVLQGGSLFMWREYFGKDARIIGIDLHPNAKELEKHGFEIYIGSQSDKNFWRNFYTKVGKIDILLDDGGHVNDQQIVTLSESVNNINDGGIIIFDTSELHTNTKELLDKDKNFIPVHFNGFQPRNVSTTTTSCYIHRNFNRPMKKLQPLGGTINGITSSVDKPRLDIQRNVRDVK